MLGQLKDILTKRYEVRNAVRQSRNAKFLHTSPDVRGQKDDHVLVREADSNLYDEARGAKLVQEK